MNIILREVPGYGWLARIEENEKEIYRGEFRETVYGAITYAMIWLEEHKEGKC